MTAISPGPAPAGPPGLSGPDGGTPSPAQPVQLIPGMRVRVHYNLRRGGFSIVVRNRVAANVPCITLTAVTFHVQPAGVARIRRKRRREVCAYATGVIEEFGIAPDISSMQRVRFSPDPGRPDTFTLDDGTPVHFAPRVVFAPDPASPPGRRRPGYGWIAPGTLPAAR